MNYAPGVCQRFQPDDKDSISSSLDSRAGLSVAHRGPDRVVIATGRTFKQDQKTSNPRPT